MFLAHMVCVVPNYYICIYVCIALENSHTHTHTRTIRRKEETAGKESPDPASSNGGRSETALSTDLSNSSDTLTQVSRHTMYRVCTVYCTVCTVCTVYCTVYTVYCTVYCTVYTVYCTVCTVYTVYCTVYTVCPQLILDSQTSTV